MSRVPSEVLIRKEQNLDLLLPSLPVFLSPCLLVCPAADRPLQNIAAVAAGADRAAVLAHERLNRGRTVHISNGHDPLAGACILKLGPAAEGLVEIRHVGHRAPRPKVGEDHPNVFWSEDVRRLGHEVYTAENDKFRILLICCLAGKLKAIPREIREVDHRILLIMVPQNDEFVTQSLLGQVDANAQLRVGQLLINGRQRLLPHLHGSILWDSAKARHIIRTVPPIPARLFNLPVFYSSSS